MRGGDIIPVFVFGQFILYSHDRATAEILVSKQLWKFEGN